MTREEQGEGIRTESRGRLRGRRLRRQAEDDRDGYEAMHDFGRLTYEATIASGLKPGILTLASEKKRYGGMRGEYLKARDHVLRMWYSDTTVYLSESACIGRLVERNLNVNN